jgi:hypothetical protein
MANSSPHFSVHRVLVPRLGAGLARVFEDVRELTGGVVDFVQLVGELINAPVDEVHQSSRYVVASGLSSRKQGNAQVAKSVSVTSDSGKHAALTLAGLVQPDVRKDWFVRVGLLPHSADSTKPLEYYLIQSSQKLGVFIELPQVVAHLSLHELEQVMHELGIQTLVHIAQVLGGSSPALLAHMAWQFMNQVPDDGLGISCQRTFYAKDIR